MGIKSLTAPGYKSIYRDYFLHQSHHAINSITGGIDISTNTSVYNIALGVEIYVRGVFSKLPSLFIIYLPVQNLLVFRTEAKSPTFLLVK